MHWTHCHSVSRCSFTICSYDQSSSYGACLARAAKSHVKHLETCRAGFLDFWSEIHSLETTLGSYHWNSLLVVLQAKLLRLSHAQATRLLIISLNWTRRYSPRRPLSRGSCDGLWTILRSFKILKNIIKRRDWFLILTSPGIKGCSHRNRGLKNVSLTSVIWLNAFIVIAMAVKKPFDL